MRVLMLHNRYRLQGGEDRSVACEVAMLRARGHIVELLEQDNRQHDFESLLSRTTATIDATWSRSSALKVRSAIREFRPDVLHVQNFFPLWSPVVFSVAHECGVPTVAHLRNFRLVCVNASLFRQGAVCTDCVGKAPWRGVVRRCYRGSMFASLAVAGMIGTHRLVQTWQREVDAFVVLSKHAHGVFQTAGLPVNRLHIKPNFADDPGPEVVDLEPRAGAIYVGRLSAEKGVQTLINAWSGSPGDLVVAGAGPLAGELASLSSAGVRFIGQVGAEAIPTLLRRAAFAVVPSEWYEPFGRAVVEAYACGTPVLAARVGALPELVIDGITGLLFEPGDASDLARNANWLATHPAEARRMGRAARALFEERFSESANYPQLIEVYRAAEAAFSARRVG